MHEATDFKNFNKAIAYFGKRKSLGQQVKQLTINERLDIQSLLKLPSFFPTVKHVTFIDSLQDILMETTAKSIIYQHQAALVVELTKWSNIEGLYTGIGSKASDDFLLATYFLSEPALVNLTNLIVSIREIYFLKRTIEVSVSSLVEKLGVAPSLKSLVLIGFDISLKDMEHLKLINIQSSRPQKDNVTLSDKGDLSFDCSIAKSSVKKLVVYIPSFDKEDDQSTHSNKNESRYALDIAKKIVHLKIQLKERERNPNQDYGNAFLKWLTYIRLKYTGLTYFKVNVDSLTKVYALTLMENAANKIF